MSARLRTLDSKISFFAFADIITAVSGMLIFITLLLATDLGRPTQSTSQDTDPQTQQRLDDTLRQQLETDAQNKRLGELLATAQTAPALEIINSDIERLRSSLASEQQKQSAISNQMTRSNSGLQERDRTLGLTELKITVQDTVQEAEAIAQHETKVRHEMDGLEQQVASAQARLLGLQARDRQIWLIPDRASTTKEPILVSVSGAGASAEAFDHPEKHQQWDATHAQSSLKGYLRDAKPLNQYVVFLVRPSGIQLFQELLESTRKAGFDVGFDALEEDRDVHFSTPPPIDESLPASNPSTNKPTQAEYRTNNNPPANSNSQPVVTPTATNTSPTPARTSPPLPTKSWWQRFLAWLGL
jgi:hypothetical protein